MFCLDTNIIIYALNRRRPEVDERLRQELTAGTRLMIPTIVLYELRYGIAKSDRPARSARILEAFLIERFEIVGFDAEDAVEAGAVRAAMEAKGHAIGAYDLLIAAQARRRGAALVTHNVRELSRVPGLIVTDWVAA